jgi:hypothetical protein
MDRRCGHEDDGVDDRDGVRMAGAGGAVGGADGNGDGVGMPGDEFVRVAAGGVESVVGKGVGV